MLLFILSPPPLHSLSSLIEDHLAEVVTSTTILDDLLAECFKSHSDALVLRGCGIVVGVSLVVNNVSLEVAEDLRQVLRHAVCLRPLVVLHAELGLGLFFCGRLLHRWFIFITLWFNNFLHNNRLRKFLVFDL